MRCQYTGDNATSAEPLEIYVKPRVVEPCNGISERATRLRNRGWRAQLGTYLGLSHLELDPVYALARNERGCSRGRSDRGQDDRCTHTDNRSIAHHARMPTKVLVRKSCRATQRRQQA
jgi:hypothetical protein